MVGRRVRQDTMRQQLCGGAMTALNTFAAESTRSFVMRMGVRVLRRKDPYPSLRACQWSVPSLETEGTTRQTSLAAAAPSCDDSCNSRIEPHEPIAHESTNVLNHTHSANELVLLWSQQRGGGEVHGRSGRSTTELYTPTRRVSLHEVREKKYN